MLILLDITHPAHVHLFRHAIGIWRQHGHRVQICSRHKDLTVDLLDGLGLAHQTLSRAGRGMIGLGCELLSRGGRLWQIVRRERPDVMAAIGGTFIAPVGKLTGTPVAVFTDTEHATLSNALAFRCATAVVTPSCFREPVQSRHVSYEGYHELAYLHPNYFTPDATVLERLEVAPGEPYVIMRFVGWGASHDVGHKGLTLATKRQAVREFSQHARVFITSEAPLPEDLEPYRIRLAPEQIHHVLNYATLLYGESATMASEGAVLGTPAIFLDDDGRGYTDEQERRYGAVFNFTESLEDQQRSLAKGLELLQTPGIKAQWQAKRQQLLRDKIDVTAWIVTLIENLGA